MLLLNTQLRKIPNRILEGLPEKERKLINNTTLITNSIYVYICKILLHSLFVCNSECPATTVHVSNGNFHGYSL